MKTKQHWSYWNGVLFYLRCICIYADLHILLKNSAGRKGLEGHVGSELEFEYCSFAISFDLEYGLLYLPTE